MYEGRQHKTVNKKQKRHCTFQMQITLLIKSSPEQKDSPTVLETYGVQAVQAKPSSDACSTSSSV